MTLPENYELNLSLYACTDALRALQARFVTDGNLELVKRVGLLLDEVREISKPFQNPLPR